MSITGSLLFIDKSPVIFRSCSQSKVAQSTTESEFVAAADTAKELLWLQSLLGELEIVIQESKLKSDSQTAINAIKNSDFSRRTKHIDIRYHFIRQLHSEKVFDLEYVNTNLQLADYLTKALPRNQHERLIRLSNIVTNPAK